MKRIDVHHHFLPEAYAQKWQSSGQIPPGLRLPQWSIETALKFLDQNDIQLAVVSLSAPGLEITSSLEEAKQVARSCNEYAASMRDAHPDRFGFFATLPLANDVTAGLEEIEYALDTLRADGVTLFTSYDGRYLGHSDFEPLWQALDKRQAVVFVHPTSPKEPGVNYQGMLPRPLVDFPHETTRTAVNLLTANTVRKYPSCKIILSHGGGTLPYVATRIANLAADAGMLREKSAEEMLAEAKQFYFDVALTSFSDPMNLLTSFAAEDHVLWGSDYPFARGPSITKQIGEMSTLESSLQSSITFGAALKLFPRLSLVPAKE
ncbi:amidohydrolase family protein [Xylariaceae sp. FL0255]|nr:amidohydrolase family protein [Xylariaceae sp. FL0255]